MGYKWTSSAIANFVSRMKKKYIDGVDFKEITRDHSLVQKYYDSRLPTEVDGNRKNYYAITGETFKKMLLRAGTKQGDITCDYFIKVESMSNLITKLVFKYAETTLIKEKEAELKEKNEELNRLNILNLENLPVAGQAPATPGNLLQAIAKPPA